MPPLPRAFYRGKRILVTGGTGSIGSEIVRQLLSCNPKVVRILSRDDTKQAELQDRLGRGARIRYFIGDVRDRYRIQRAMEGVDLVFHAAAMKHVPACEYNPFEAVQTNVIGTQNVIQAALDAGVKRLVVISTDKAVNPVNTMGISKLMAERLAVTVDAWANAKTKFCAVRFGNVLGSRGSLVPLLLGQIRKGGPVTVTDPAMTRFMMGIPDAVGLVLQAGARTQGGEVFILKMPSVRIGDFVEALMRSEGKRVRVKRIGLRLGEKMHEELLTEEEIPRTRDLGPMFAVLPPHRATTMKTRIRPAQIRSDKAPLLKGPALVRLIARATP